MVSGRSPRGPFELASWKLFGVLLVAPAGLACSDTTRSGDGRVARVQGRVESSQLGVFYDVAFKPAPSLAEVTAAHPTATPAQNAATLARELAVQGEPAWASGVMTVPAQSSSGTPILAPPPANNPTRYSCGITLVSPSYAITAGHCVTDSDSDTSALKLRMYRITPALAKTYVPAALSGTYPSYSQPKLSASDGFLYDEYACTIENRCYPSSSNPAIGCPSADTSNDMALLHCTGRPGDKYGFINANGHGDPAGKEALVHWKHEVLDLGNANESLLPQDRIDHYIKLGSSPEQNYHYFDGAADLLPLRSITWSDGTPTSWSANYWSDLHGCHGTSGSGMLVRVGSTPVFELVGPVAIAGQAFGTRLCEAVPNPSGTATSGKGTAAMATDNMSPNELISLHSADFASDCHARAVAERDVSDLPYAAGTHNVATVFSHLTCQISDFGSDGTVTADPVFGPYPETFVEMSGGTAHPVNGFSVELATDVRFALQVMPREACSSNCGALTLSVGAQSFELTPHTSEPSIVGGALHFTGTNPIDLAISSSGQLRAVGGLVLIREGQVNSFDTLEDRLEAALYSVDDTGAVLAGPLPMRFAGDGQAGFEALLAPGERMALTRQALAAGHTWTVRLGAPSYDDLTCGLLDRKGAPLASLPCAAAMQLDDHAGTEGRLGFYVELAATSSRESAELRTVAIASDAAGDADGDGVPTVVDNCPNDWNPSQASCNEVQPGSGGGAGDGNGEAGAPGSGGTGGTGTGNESGEAGVGAVGPSDGGSAGAQEAAGASDVAGGEAGAESARAGTSGASSGGGTSGSGAGGSPAGGSAAGGQTGLAGSAGNAATVAGATGEGTEPPKADSGCGCRVGDARSTTTPAWVVTALLGLWIGVRRRARRVV